MGADHAGGGPDVQEIRRAGRGKTADGGDGIVRVRLTRAIPAGSGDQEGLIRSSNSCDMAVNSWEACSSPISKIVFCSETDSGTATRSRNSVCSTSLSKRVRRLA